MTHRLKIEDAAVAALRERLNRWLERTDSPAMKLASVSGVTYQNVYAIANGRMRPGAIVAAKLNTALDSIEDDELVERTLAAAMDADATVRQLRRKLAEIEALTRVRAREAIDARRKRMRAA